jgi:hypothetical protein
VCHSAYLCGRFRTLGGACAVHLVWLTSSGAYWSRQTLHVGVNRGHSVVAFSATSTHSTSASLCATARARSLQARRCVALRRCTLLGVSVERIGQGAEPHVLPLPFLAWIARHPSADGFFREALLKEVLDIAAQATASMQERWAPDGRRRWRHPLRRDTWATPDRLADLVWLQEELSGEVLDLYDREVPGRLQARADVLTERLRRRGQRHSGWRDKEKGKA